MPPTGHSKLGASGAKRWLTCPGSVALSEGMPNKSSKYAIEGTAAHQLAEECLLSGGSPYDFLGGGCVTIEDDDGFQVEYEVTDKMADGVMWYLNDIREMAKSQGISKITKDMVECRFHLDWVDDQLYGCLLYTSPSPRD